MARRAITSTAVIVAATWLFADTYDKYSAAGSRPDVIRFAHFGGYEDYELWREVIDDFETKHPDLRVRQEYVVGPGGRYNTKLRQQALTGDLPDVALIQLATFHDLANAFADLDELLYDAGEHFSSDPFDPSAVLAFRSAGVQRGWPLSGGNLAIFLNRKALRAAERHQRRSIDIPTSDWTMRDFRAFARDLTCDFDGDDRVDQFGFWSPSWVYFQPFFWGFGASLSDDGEWTLCGPSAVEALTFYRDLHRIDRVCPKNEDVPQVFQDVGFLTGRVALCVNGPWFLPFLEKSDLREDYEVLPVPTGPAGRFSRMTWDGVVVSSAVPEKRRAAATLFVLHLLSLRTQRQIAGTGRALPALDSALAAFTEGPGSRRRSIFKDTLGSSRLQPRYPYFGDIDALMNRLFFRLTERTDVDVNALLRHLSQESRIQKAFTVSSECVP